MINRREFCFALSVPLFLSPRIVSAQRAEVFLAKTHKNSHGETMPYRLFVPPAYDKGRKYPLVVWLHGGAGRGNDNLKQISGGNTNGSHVWTLPNNQTRYPCLVVAPQCPENDVWATLDTAKPSGPLQRVLELLQDLQQRFNVDPQRFYVAGQSLGGFGTWAVISEHPGMFAAAIPICGGGDSANAAKLMQTPIWAFHGEVDEAVRVGRSREMISAIKLAGGTPKYTEYKGAGHAIWERVFTEPELLSWVFAQKRQTNS